jgi:hypothetical protein
MSEEIIQNTEHAVDNTANLSLGRLPSIDFRDRQFSLKPPAASKIERRKMHYITAKALDQKDTPHCVAFSGHQFLLSSPVKNLPFSKTEQLYDECQQNDEWAGTDYDGTSVRALFKVLKAHGYVAEYRWAFDIDTVVRHLLTTSPVVFGTNWYWDMFEPDENGFIRIGGGIAGGHAYMVKGVNLDKVCPDGTKGAIRIINSWGQNWGQGGKAWISLKDANRLIVEWGEACTSRELKFHPVDPAEIIIPAKPMPAKFEVASIIDASPSRRNLNGEINKFW